MTTEHNGERISYSYLPPVDGAQLTAKRRNIEFWAHETLGLMGRFPDFCAELTVGMLNFAQVLDRADPRWGANARAYQQHCASADLCLTHALNDQYYDRGKSAAEQDDPDLILRVVRETSAGPVVRGVRALATLAPVSDEVLVSPNRPRAAGEADYSLAFALPMNAPGLKIVCRDLYAEHADPERFPLTTRFDEVDATLIFDDVVVPWERIFVYRDPALAFRFFVGTRTWSTYSTMVRLIAKLETFLGVTQLLTRWANRDGTPDAQRVFANYIQDIEVVRACVQAAEINAVRTDSGLWAPAIHGGYRLAGIEAADRAERTMQDLLTSYLIVTGGAADVNQPGIGPLIERYFRGGAPSTPEHLRAMALAADMVMSQFGTRNRLYERLQSGEPDALRKRLSADYKDDAPLQRVQRFIAAMDSPVKT